MITFVRNFAFLGLAAAGALLANQTPAHAALTLRATAQDASFIQVVDGGAGDIDGAVNGEIELATATFGGFSVRGSFHASNANFSSSAGPLDTTIGIGVLNSGSSSVTNISGASNSVLVELSDTNFGIFNAPGVIVTTSASGTFGNPLGTLGSSVNSSYYVDSSNTLFGTGALAHNFVGTSNGTSPFSYSDPQFNAGFFAAPGFFSMTERFLITLNAGTSLTSRGNNMQATAVPEPATVLSLLVGMPLMGLGAWARKRRAQS
jgi:hypothetical protein